MPLQHYPGVLTLVLEATCPGNDIPASRIVFATDYPQEIRQREAVRDFVRELRALGADGERILSGNVCFLLKEPPAPERTKIEERMW